MKLVKLIIGEFKNWLGFLIRGLPGISGDKIRVLMYKPFLRKGGKKISISQGCYLRDLKNISLGSNITIGIHAQIYASGTGKESITIGDRVNLNSNVMINADCEGTIEIGKNVLIGPNVVLRASNHQFKSKDLLIKEQGHQAGNIKIYDDVWIGANVVILPNVEIKKGAVIAAGAVVTRDVESYSVVGGVPARQIGKRE